MFIIGQKKIVNEIDNGLLDNSNFFIIKGPRSYGKTFITKYIANHFKMNYILLDNKVSTIRELVANSRNNNNCLYHFKDFNKSSPAAKAALLKIAEETPKGIKIIVTMNNGTLLQTLISRAYCMNVEAYTKENILEYNNILEFDNDLLEKLLEDYKIIMTPTELMRYKNKLDFGEILDIVDKTIEAINRGITLEDASIIANNFYKDDRERLEIYLELLAQSIYKTEKQIYYKTSVVEIIRHRLETITITNYRQLVHDLLMELV